MPIRSNIIIIIACLIMTTGAMADPGLIYGKIYTTDDEVIEGFIRWDKNEVAWDDILDGDKELDREVRERDRYRPSENDDDEEITIFGVTIYKSGKSTFNINWSDNAQSGIRFGHIKTLIPDGNDEVLLALKSGNKVVLENGSGDIGSDNREILIDTEDEGIIELYWDDIEKIEFEKTPARETRFGNRLFGTVVADRGEEYTGFICWDMDEAFDSDILDGTEDNRKRKVKFEKIESIERQSSSSAIITLMDGKKIRMKGTNDIDNGNRGIVISDKSLGRLVVNWDDFDYVEFKKAPDGPSYDDFDGGKVLKGKVFTENGEEFKGEIKWDDDEEFTWELLDGKLDDVDFAIEFDQIKSIEKVSRNGAEVLLKDGRKFKLHDSNDVDSDNKGILIKSDDDEVIVDWHDFERLELE
jgi:hypothetical protein